MTELEKLAKEITRCTRCARLRKYCAAVAAKRKREFASWEYWGKPVPGFGDPKAKIWIVGLAPAAHGANRTGRMFTGDSSGNWLYRALHRSGFASQAQSTDRNDGLILKGAYISSAGRCAPPDNKPTPKEIENCAPFLDTEYRLLSDVRLFLALGSIGFNAILQLLKRHGEFTGKKPKFAHNGLHRIGKFQVLTSYHPSRQNTQTGRLTESMWNAIFDRARSLVRS